ncbi:MAG: hypothetical protein QM813_21530 [Verrucomicrobiota bacterium]
MNCRFLLLILTIVGAGSSAASPEQLISESTNVLGFVTNGPVIWESRAITRVYSNSPPAYVLRHAVTNTALLHGPTRDYTFTNLAFYAFQSSSLSYLVWTNFLAITNGRDLRIWTERGHAPGWPKQPPYAKWNTNSIIWGMKGALALSPCWEGEGAPGQVPLTALTRRHVYTRGHHLGPETKLQGQKAWFVRADNELLEFKIKQCIIRVPPTGPGDYTVMLLDRDLPESIEPVAAARLEDMQKFYPVPTAGSAPYPFFQSEQGGNVSTGVAPLTVNTWKGGDSGSPNFIPLPGLLVFVSGRSTSGPSPAMQADMDELCRREKLDPKKYQLRWVDLGKLVGQ